MRNIMTRNGKILSREGLVLTTPRPLFDFVVIGNQRWMNKNLAIDDGQGGIYTRTVNYGQGDVTEYYYTLDAAVRVANSIQGWHLPSNDEFGTLASYVGGQSTAGTKLKSTYGWVNDGNGTDDYGFAAFPAGIYYSGAWSDYGKYATFWTATEYSSTVSTNREFESDSFKMIQINSSKLWSFSVRLIKDVD